MLNYLKVYLDINNIISPEKYLEIGKLLEGNPNLNILNYTKYGFILEYFQKLVNNKISLEKFMSIGDIHSDVSIYQSKLYLESVFTINFSVHKLKDSILLIENLAWNYYQTIAGSESDNLLQKFADNNIKFFIF